MKTRLPARAHSELREINRPTPVHIEVSYTSEDTIVGAARRYDPVDGYTTVGATADTACARSTRACLSRDNISPLVRGLTHYTFCNLRRWMKPILYRDCGSSNRSPGEGYTCIEVDLLFFFFSTYSFFRLHTTAVSRLPFYRNNIDTRHYICTIREQVYTYNMYYTCTHNINYYNMYIGMCERSSSRSPDICLWIDVSKNHLCTHDVCSRYYTSHYIIIVYTIYLLLNYQYMYMI